MLAGCAAARPVAKPEASCGDAVIASQADVARLAGCASLHDVTVRTGGAVNLAGLRALTTITGDLTIGPTVGVEDVALEALREIRGRMHVVGNGLMQGLFLRKLERAGAIAVDGNPALTTIALPALQTATALRVTDNASLELLDIVALGKLDGELVVTGAPRLTLLDAQGLKTAARVELEAPKLPADTVAALRAIARPDR